MNTPPAAESGAYPQPRERATSPHDSTDDLEAVGLKRLAYSDESKKSFQFRGGEGRLFLVTGEIPKITRGQSFWRRARPKDPPFEYDTIEEAENPPGWDRL
jgi:hypothetical protein